MLSSYESSSEMERIRDQTDAKKTFSISTVLIIVIVVICVVLLVVLYVCKEQSLTSLNNTGQSGTGNSETASSVQDSYVPNDLLEIHNEKYHQYLQNSASVEPVVEHTGKPCLGEFKEIVLGFNIENELVPSVYVCFDSLEKNTKYTVHAIPPEIGDKKYSNKRQKFQQGNFFDENNINVDKQYTKKSQRETINTSLELHKASSRYIKSNGNDFFARGHFTPKTDFVHSSQQDLTFHFVNAAPQNQKFNNTNWKRIEKNIRDYAKKSGQNLFVYTGPHGVVTLPHEKTGEDTELFLFTKDGKKAIPIPHLFWKVVYNDKTKASVALIGVNNPFYKDPLKDVICNDISSEIDWVDWKKMRTDGGYCYACHVDDLRKTVQLPYFRVDSLLI